MSAPVLAALFLLVVTAALGILPIRKMIEVYEAKHELKRGSAGAIRTISGWSIIALWIAATWFVATILGDWHASGDLSGAIERSWVRLEILLEILAALGDD